MNESLRHIWFGASLQSLKVFPVLNWFSEPVELSTELTEFSWQMLVNEELALDLAPFLGLTGDIGSPSTDFSKIEVRQHYSACCSPLLYCLWNKCMAKDKTQNPARFCPLSSWLKLAATINLTEGSDFNLKDLICSFAKCKYLRIEVGPNLRGVKG